MSDLHSSGLAEFIFEMQHQQSTPIVGICIGLHMLCRSSAEDGGTNGLALFDMSVSSIPRKTGIRVPHFGNSPIRLRTRGGGLLRQGESLYYFAHSFASFDTDDVSCISTAHYSRDFVAIAQRGLMTGVQFHPELSGLHGLQLLSRAISGVPL